MADGTAELSRVSRPPYPLGIPGKFDIDGNVQPFPGNTIVSHLAPSSALYASMLELYAKLEKSHLAPLYALLPPSSWHMTVFEGVCDQVRKPEFWSVDVPLDAPLEKCTSVFAERLSAFDLQCSPPYLMRVAGFDPFEIGIGVHLEPRTAEEDARLRGLRDELSDTLKIRHPSHDTYGLHFSIAYLLRHLTPDQHSELRTLVIDHCKTMPVEFELGAPEFCTFEDMFAFKRQFYLKSQA
jgi:hypothetical protein